MARFKRILLKLSGESLMGEKAIWYRRKNVWVNMRNKSRKYTTLAYK